MKNTVVMLIESELPVPVDTFEDNLSEYNELEKVDESTSELFGYNPEKVIVMAKENDNRYFIEFNSNLERLMKDARVSLTEAVDMVTDENEIEPEDVSVVMDESCLNKIDFKKLGETKFKIVRI